MKLAIFAAVATVALIILWSIQGPATPAGTRLDQVAVSYSAGDVPELLDDVEAVAGFELRTSVLQTDAEIEEAAFAGDEGTAAGDLRVRVVDVAGQPLGGVPLAIVEQSPRSRWNVLEAATAAGSGLATFSAMDLESAIGAEAATGATFLLGIDVPGIDLEYVELNPRALPKDVIELTAQPFGSLEVRIRDGAGVAVPDYNHLYITPLFEHPTERGRLERGERVALRAKDASEVNVPYVPVGTQLRVEVYDEGVRPGVHQEIEGLSAGEHRVVTLVVNGAIPHVTGRLVLGDGTALEASSLSVAFKPSGSARVPIETGGSFVLPLSRLRAGPDGRFSAVLSVQLSAPDGSRSDVEALSGRFDAVVPSADAPTDVGIVVMREPPVFVSGTVVDSAGDPVEGGYVSLYEKFNQRSDPEDFGWNFAGVDYAYTDAEGRFQVAVNRPPGEYAIRAHAQGYVDRQAVRFASGTRDLVLPVDRERFLSGRLLLPEGVEPAGYSIVAKVPGATREETTYVSFQSGVMADGTFKIGGLRAPAVTLSLMQDDTRVELASLEGLLPEADAEVVPARLNPWDLRQKLRLIGFRIRLSDGALAPRGLVAYGGEPLQVIRGRVEALVRVAEEGDVFIVAPGHLPTSLPARSLPDEVHLVPGIPVRVSVDTALPTLPEGAALSLSLDCESRSWLPWASAEWKQLSHLQPRRSLWTEEVTMQSGETQWTVYVPSVGSYRPRWTVRHPTDDAVLQGWRVQTFGTITGAYEIEVNQPMGSDRRWLVQPSLREATEAMHPRD